MVNKAKLIQRPSIEPGLPPLQSTFKGHWDTLYIEN